MLLCIRDAGTSKPGYQGCSGLTRLTCKHVQPNEEYMQAVSGLFATIFLLNHTVSYLPQVCIPTPHHHGDNSHPRRQCSPFVKREDRCRANRSRYNNTTTDACFFRRHHYNAEDMVRHLSLVFNVWSLILAGTYNLCYDVSAGCPVR